jgi:hypothetical protein
MLTNIHKNLVGFIIHKFVRIFTHICEKILEICVKLGKSCFVGSGPGLRCHFLMSELEGWHSSLHSCTVSPNKNNTRV